MGLVAAALAQPLELPLAFDALCGDGHVQAVAEREDGVGDGGIARGSIEIVDERLVDLNAVRGKARDVGELGVAGSEIIECDGAAELAQPLEGDADPPRVLDQHRLGDFDFDERGRNARRGGFDLDHTRRIAV